ncbi:MAG: hypothetical protein JJU36_11230 [Phycisphaeraceae bacterium]|nr:hypothetical protein [Phycisphaeraceae bacterium]
MNRFLALPILAAIIVAGCAGPAVERITVMDTDEASTFAQRQHWYLKQIAHQDAMKTAEWSQRVWPQTGHGDPHKYVLPAVLAQLALDVEDANALAAYRHLMEVDRAKGDRGLYHFAAYLRARMYFQFGDRLPEDVRKSNEYDARHFYHIMMRGGTENHGIMQRASGFLWSERVEDPVVRDGRDAAWVRDWIRGQIRRWYHQGAGEYDSSTYYGFSSASILNIADFARDEVMRDYGRAGIDWFAASMALKYFHGVHLGPESRGFAHEAVGAAKGEQPIHGKGGAEFTHRGTGSRMDWISWLWTGHTQGYVPMDDPDSRTLLIEDAAVVMAMSDYQPHPIIRNLARKDVPLPFESRGSKPVYYNEPDRHGRFTGDNKDQEVLYFAENFAMGTLYSNETGVAITGTILPQTTMFKALLRDADAVRTFGISSGYHGHFPLEGRTPFDQYHQKGAAAIHVAYVDPAMVGNDEARRARVREQSILGMPEAVGKPTVRQGWYFWRVGDAYLAARPLNGKADWATDEQVMHREPRSPSGWQWLVSPGRLSGWVVQLGERPAYADLEAFIRAVMADTRLDLSEFDEQRRTVRFRSLAGDDLAMSNTATVDRPGGKPRASVNGEQLIFADWPVFESPYLSIPVNSGRMTVRDGRRELIVDLTGERPTWTVRPLDR